MATVHLVHGFLGSGKTTFSMQLAQRTGALRLSVDEWYLRLFAKQPTYEYDRERGVRLLEVLNDLWPTLVARGIDVVLDFGFWHRALRDEVRQRAEAAGASTRLYWLDCPDEEALQRCLARNGTPGAFLISQEGYHALKREFEPLEADEVCERVPLFHEPLPSNSRGTSNR
jgi:predicted kinase